MTERDRAKDGNRFRRVFILFTPLYPSTPEGLPGLHFIRSGEEKRIGNNGIHVRGLEVLMMSMKKHVKPARLAELTRMDYILDQPEWLHIRTCEECLDQFASIVEFDLKQKEIDNFDPRDDS